MTDEKIQAALILLFGTTKHGKTSAALATYPRALCFGVADSLRLTWTNTLALPADKLWIAKKAPRTLMDLEGILSGIERQEPDKRPRQIIVDDFGKIVETTYYKFDSSPDAITDKGKKNNFYAGQQIQPILERICEKARHLGTAVVFIMHEKPPGFDSNDNFRKGGPNTPWRAFGEKIEEWFDINLRVTMDEDSLDPWFNRSFYCKAGSDWHVGDRSEVCWETTPGSLYEVLRAGGSHVERFPGLEWLDDVAGDVVECLENADAATREDAQLVIQNNAHRWAKGRDQKHVRWAVQDGIARYVIKRHRERNIFDFGLDTADNGGKSDNDNSADSGSSGTTGTLPPN